MIALVPPQYAAVKPLLDDVPFNTLFAQVVLDREVPGSVFADDSCNPRVAYVWHPYGMSLLFGQAGESPGNAEILRSVVEAPDHSAARDRRAEVEWLQVSPSAWTTAVQGLSARLAGKLDIEENARLNFVFRPDRFARFAMPDLEPGAGIVRTSGEIFDSLDGAVVPKRFWRDRDHFLSTGLGYSLLKGGEIAATAFASFVKDGKLELGIETHPEYRGKGLAAIVCARLIAYCLDNDLEPVWSCREANVGSVRLAEKLGFVQTLRMPYFRLARLARRESAS